MGDKITISWDEVRSSSVDQKLQQAAAGRDEGPEPAESSSALMRILYHTLVYSTLFGLGGGFLAGVVGEVVWLVRGSTADDYDEYVGTQMQLTLQANSGEISEAEFEQQSQELDQRFARNRIVVIENNPSLSEAQKEEQIAAIQASESSRSLVCMAYWFVLVAMLMALCLSVADQAMGRNVRGMLVNGSVGIAIALLGAFFGACFASIIYNLMGGGTGENLPLQILARALGWGAFGGFLSIAPGVVLMNWKRFLIGLAGGLIGGTLGGTLFDPIAMATGSGALSRFVATMVIGALTGFGTGLLESAAKTGWLRVTHGLIAGKQFILYKDTTRIGSSPQCDVYLFKDTSISPRHAAIHKRGGAYEIEDLGSATATYVNGSAVSRTRLKRGDQIQIGSTVLLFLERARS